METLPPQPISSYQYPPPPQSTGVPQGYGPGPAPPAFAPPPPLVAESSLDHGPARTIRATKSTAEFALREYMTLQGRRYRGEIGIEEQLRQQAGVVVRDLRMVRAHVADMVHAAEGHRWRRWLIGGVVCVVFRHFPNLDLDALFFFLRMWLLRVVILFADLEGAAPGAHSSLSCGGCSGGRRRAMAATPRAMDSWLLMTPSTRLGRARA